LYQFCISDGGQGGLVVIHACHARTGRDPVAVSGLAAPVLALALVPALAPAEFVL